MTDRYTIDEIRAIDFCDNYACGLDNDLITELMNKAYKEGYASNNPTRVAQALKGLREENEDLKKQVAHNDFYLISVIETHRAINRRLEEKIESYEKEHHDWVKLIDKNGKLKKENFQLREILNVTKITLNGLESCRIKPKETP
jgi:DNA repair exonuclease SbcCD ATPase subunit